MSKIEIPTIDMRLFEDDPSAFSEQIGAAFREYGFAGFSHHGVADDLVSSAYEVFKDFFDRPVDEKMQTHLEGKGGARGYTAFGIEHAKDSDAVDLKEFWQVGRTMPEDHPLADQYPANPWPAEPAAFGERARQLFEGLEGAGMRVLQGVARHLELPSDYFEDKVNYGNSILRAIHYPPIEGEPEGVRAAAHEDINVITLLVGSGEPGLEILSKKGDWVPVDTVPGTIMCNVGDMLQRHTNHQLRSTTHRVVNPPAPWCHGSRFSIPFFLHFNSDFLIDTLAGCIDDDHPRVDPEPITADAYLRERLVEIGLLPDEES